MSSRSYLNILPFIVFLPKLIILEVVILGDLEGPGKKRGFFEVQEGKRRVFPQTRKEKIGRSFSEWDIHSLGCRTSMNWQDLKGDDDMGHQRRPELGPWGFEFQQRCLCPNCDTEAAEPLHMEGTV